MYNPLIPPAKVDCRLSPFVCLFPRSLLSPARSPFLPHFSLLIFLSLVFIPPATHAGTEPAHAWPAPIPCRVRDGANRDLLVMTLGDVETPLADGVFDPLKDEVTL